MRKKILVISISIALIGLLGLLRVVSAQVPEQASGVGAKEAPNGMVGDTQAGQQRRHILGDDIVDTPLEVDAIYLGHKVVGAPLDVHKGD